MFVPCILSAITVKTWYQSMRVLFCRLKRKTSGQAAKQMTVRQKWTMENFSFLSAHLCIWAEHSQLGRVQTPALPVNPEGEDEGGDDEDAASVTSSQMPSQLPTSFQAVPSQPPPRDRRPPRAASSGSGWKVDKAILKLADRLSQNPGMQDRLQSAVQESALASSSASGWVWRCRTLTSTCGHSS